MVTPAHPFAREAKQREPRKSDASAACVELSEASLVVDGVLHLSRISLRVEAGESVAVLVPPGAGKSVLLDCIEGLNPPCSGRAMVWGMDSHRLQRLQRGEIGRIGVSAEPPPLLQVGQVLDLVDAESAASRSGWGRGYQLRRALGLDDLRGARLEALTPGERKSVLAWVALSRPRRLLLLDEPCQNLTRRQWHEVWAAIDAQRAEFGCSVLMATADPVAAQRCDRVLALRGGRLLLEGPASVQAPRSARAATRTPGRTTEYLAYTSPPSEGPAPQPICKVALP